MRNCATEDQERAMMAPMANISHTMGLVTDAEAPGATVDGAPERRGRAGERRRTTGASPGGASNGADAAAEEKGQPPPRGRIPTPGRAPRAPRRPANRET